jgi:hypothetical protein
LFFISGSAGCRRSERARCILYLVGNKIMMMTEESAAALREWIS